jgi:hypothetical protein
MVREAYSVGTYDCNRETLPRTPPNLDVDGWTGYPGIVPAALETARAWVAAVSAGVALGVTVASCRSPTEIKVVVTTDFDCADLKDVTVTVGTLGDALESDPPASTSSSCSDGGVGTLVVVPSGSDHAEIGIKVVGGSG